MAAPSPAPGNATKTGGQSQQAQVNGTHANHAHHNHNHAQTKGKKKVDNNLPVDPQAMYESLKSKIAALEEELTHADEEEERFGMLCSFIFVEVFLALSFYTRQIPAVILTDVSCQTYS
jgi:hypothetical protein